MDAHMRQSLDNYITGHYGEDDPANRDEIDLDAPWECPACGQVNDATQSQCNKCHTSRPQDEVDEEEEDEGLLDNGQDED